MRRRDFIMLFGGVAAARPPTARAQQPAKVAHIGYLSLGPASAWTSRVDALRGGLRDLGWIEARFIFEIVHCGHARQNRRPIPLRTRVAGSGVSGRCALSRVSRAQNDECAMAPKG